LFTFITETEKKKKIVTHWGFDLVVDEEEKM
jgi:hypothetical protein